MTVLPLTEIDGVPETFYVPRFKLKLRGSDAPRNLLADVKSVTYEDSIDKIDTFSFVLSNWDATERAFKYAGFDPALPPGGPEQVRRAELLEPSSPIELWLGYGDRLKKMLVGRITALEPDFPNAGGSTLTVRGLNELHRYKRRQHSAAWRDKTDSEIAREFDRQPSETRPGIGIPVRTQPRDPEPREQFVFMHNQFDIEFLLERARRRGYTVSMEIDEQGDPYVRFGASLNVSNDPIELRYGRTLMNFRPKLTTANQVGAVTVRGWDRAGRRVIEGTARIGDRGLAINSDQRAVASAVAEVHEVVTRRPVRNAEAARALARDILAGQLQDMVRGSGASIGHPGLRSGRRVVIAGIGPRFGGTYLLTKTTHTLDDTGYKTVFEARREEPEP